MQHPTTYLYKEQTKGYEVYLGEFSTLDGLKLTPRDTKIELTEAGATNYKNRGWTSEEDLPKFRTVGDIVDFLEAEEGIGLIHFEANLDGVGKLSTHDDGECHFILNSRATAIDLINKAAPDIFKAKILAKLLENRGKYIDIDTHGRINEFHTFDEYIKSKNRT